MINFLCNTRDGALNFCENFVVSEDESLFKIQDLEILKQKILQIIDNHLFKFIVIEKITEHYERTFERYQKEKKEKLMLESLKNTKISGKIKGLNKIKL